MADLKDIDGVPLYQVGNEVASGSPFGENSVFFKSIQQYFVSVENDVKGTWKGDLKQSQSGQDLIEEYKKYDTVLAKSKGIHDLETDFIIYLETDYEVDLGKVLLIKMSNAMRQYCIERLKNDFGRDFLLGWGKGIVKQQKENPNFKATAQDIKNAFLIEIEYREIQYRNESKISNVEFIDKIFEGISDDFRKLKLSRERWDPTLGSDKYLFHSVTKAIEFIQAKTEAAIKLLHKIIEKVEVLKFLPFLFPTTIRTINFQLINSIIKFLKLLIENLRAFHILLSSQKYEKPLSFAFWCGVYNGSVEFVAGILDIILLVIKLYVYSDIASSSEFKIDILSLKEGLEELIEKFIENPDLLVDAIDKYYKERYEDENLTDYQTSHNFGEDLILVIDIVVSIVTVVKGLGKLLSKLPKFTKWIDDVLGRRKKMSIDKVNPDILSKIIKQSNINNFYDDFQLRKIISIAKIKKLTTSELEIFAKTGSLLKMKHSKILNEITDFAKLKQKGFVKYKIKNVIGKFSKRPFDINNCGGKILSLDWKNIKIQSEGIEIIKTHLTRFDDSLANQKMIERLEKIQKGEIKTTDYDKRFYTHEIREYQRYKNIGVKDGTNPYYVWDNTHSATLEDFKIYELDKDRNSILYHPETYNLE